MNDDPFIASGMADVHRRLEKAGYLRGLQHAAFARAAAGVIGDVNDIHPFRKGNGRSQIAYLEQLAEQAGHRIDAGKIDSATWIKASRAAHRGDISLLEREIVRIGMGGDREMSR